MAGTAEGYAPQQGGAAAGGPASGGSSPGDETASSGAPAAPPAGALRTPECWLSPARRQSKARTGQQAPPASQAGCKPACRRAQASVVSIRLRLQTLCCAMQGTGGRWLHGTGAGWAAMPMWPSHAPCCCTTRADTRWVRPAATNLMQRMMLWQWGAVVACKAITVSLAAMSPRRCVAYAPSQLVAWV